MVQCHGQNAPKHDIPNGKWDFYTAPPQTRSLAQRDDPPYTHYLVAFSHLTPPTVQPTFETPLTTDAFIRTTAVTEHKNSTNCITAKSLVSCRVRVGYSRLLASSEISTSHHSTGRPTPASRASAMTLNTALMAFYAVQAQCWCRSVWTVHQRGT